MCTDLDRLMSKFRPFCVGHAAMKAQLFVIQDSNDFISCSSDTDEHALPLSS